MSVCVSLICTAWLSAAQLKQLEIDQPVLDLIQTKSSMTQKMRSLSDNVKVKVLMHQYESVNEEDARYLQVPLHSKAIIREVIIYGNDQPWMYAISVFPDAVIKVTGDQLASLNEKPLGEVLFSRKDVHRGEFQFTQLNAEQSMSIFKKAKVNSYSDRLLARRSWFEIQHHRLSVFEVFLPAFLEKIQ